VGSSGCVGTDDDTPNVFARIVVRGDNEILNPFAHQVTATTANDSQYGVYGWMNRKQGRVTIAAVSFHPASWILIMYAE
jgi:hypothetical protein